MNNIIPEDLGQFILQHIDSIAQLEGLLIFRAEPEQSLTAEHLTRLLFIHESQAEVLLTHLHDQGFITRISEVSYRYHPQSAELNNIIDRLAELYRQYLIPVTNLIHSKPKSRIQQFADAFKLRKD